MLLSFLPRPYSKILILSFLLAVGTGLSGCASVVIGGAVATGTAVAQERSVGAAVDDAATQAHINTLLIDESIELFGDVNLTVIEGRVYMTGTVDSAESRAKAAEIAFNASGVKQVVNELQVVETNFIDFAKDSAITSQLRFRILADKDIRDINYSIDTVNRKVYLMGIARNRNELERIAFHARSIESVSEVISHIRVVGEK